MARYDALKERALCNAEALFDYWKLDYVKINDVEYDFINPTRKDNNHGACRFNVNKGRGADFTGSNIKESEIRSFGSGFTRDDFAGIGQENHWGFDIISLFQRLHGLNTYADAARFLRKQLAELSKLRKLNKPLPNASEIREHKRNEYKLKTLKNAERTWRMCNSHIGTLGDIYLRSRKLYTPNNPNIKFHSKIYNSELKSFLPALLFRVQQEPNAPLCAIHRIYLDEKGNKANLTTPKAALGSIYGAGIWFGDFSSEVLSMAEGAENALSILSLGYSFVVSTINATNFSNLTIPKHVKKIILFPDPDEAGKTNSRKAINNYKKSCSQISIVFPPAKKLPSGKLVDWNNIITGVGDNI